MINERIVYNKPLQHSNGDAKPINYEKILEEFDKDKEFLDEVIDVFIINAKSQIKTMRQAMADNNSEAISREAHSLKGAASNLCANSLYEAAFDLDKISKSSDYQYINSALESLVREFERFENYIKSLRKE